MQADQYRVGLQVERVADHVMAAREIEHAMRLDGLLDRGGVVGDAVAFDAERVDVDPLFSRRQRGNRRRQRRGQRAAARVAS